MNGKFQKHRLRIIKETGDDKIVLGMPWLKKENPSIDWSSRTIKTSGIASKDSEGKQEQPVPQKKNLENREKEYQQEIEEIRNYLPEEIKDFADVFSTTK